MKINVKVAIDKSFDDDLRILTKEYEDGDVAEFMKIEGDYIESLIKITKEHGSSGDSFQVSYAVLVEVE